jgi:hypothetical protein
MNLETFPEKKNGKQFNECIIPVLNLIVLKNIFFIKGNT